MNENTQSAALCVQCNKKPQSEHYKPFCSKRCADIDLHRWLNEGYAIPSVEEEPSSDGEGQEDD